jgi:tRNA threonylcarbamoyladenosine biosynthesis protein TsaE
MNIMEFIYNFNDINKIAYQLKNIIKKGQIIILEGNPGVGKSTLIYQLINIIENNNYVTQSPSFTKINEYPSIVHMDLYYCNNLDIYRDYFISDKFIFIEWGNLFQSITWHQWWSICLLDDGTRKLTIKFN